MRGVCALTVFVFHLFPLPSQHGLHSHGYIAVDAFFIISGFVIAASYEDRLRNGLSLLDFLYARVRRLGPTYWFGLSLGAVSWIWILTVAHHIAASAALISVVCFLVLEAVLIPTLSGGSMNSFTLNSPAWSIFGELAVNVLYASSVRRLTNSTLVLTICVGWLATLCIALLSGHGWDFGWLGGTILLSPIRAAPAFAMGVLLFRVAERGWLSHLPNGPAWLPVALWCGMAFMPATGHILLLDSIFVMVLTPALVAWVVRSEAFAPRWSTALGRLSYPLYLCQMPLILTADTIRLRWGIEALLPIQLAVAAVTLAISWGVARTLEPPAKRIVRQETQPETCGTPGFLAEHWPPGTGSDGNAAASIPLKPATTG